MQKKSKILIVGHNDIIEKSLARHFTSRKFAQVFSSSQLGLDVLDQDPDMIKVAVKDTIRDTIRQFGEQQPEKVTLYENGQYNSY